MKALARMTANLSRSGAARDEAVLASTPSASLSLSGSGAPSHRRTRVGILVFAIAALLALALVPSASAATRLLKTSFGTFSGQSPRGLTVDQSNGDVYAINFNNNTLDRFDASGSPKNFTCGTCSGNQLSIPTINSIDVDLVHVAIDRSGGPSDGNIYVTDGSGTGVDVFSNSGALLTTLTGSGTFDGAFSVAVGVSVDQQNGDVYIADAGNSRIYRYSPSGSTVAEGDYSGAITTDITAGSVAADAGKVYLGDTCCFSDSTVERYNATDFALGSPPTPSPTVIDTRHPTDLAVDPSTGDLYVDEGDQIHVFDSTGASTYIFGDGDFGNAGFTSWSTGVAVVGNAGKAYVADPAANKIKVYPLLTRLLKTSFGTFSGQSPRGLTVDQSNGDVYAINFNNNTLDRFDASGSPKNFTCGTCSGNQLSIPTINSIDVDLVHVAIDRSGGPSDGNIYVTDGSGTGVDVFSNSGALLTTLTGSGTFDGAFSVAVGVSVDQQNGDVYIADAGNSRIYRYSPSGSTVAEGDYSGAITTDITAGSVAADAGKVYLGDTCCFSDSTVERYNATDFALGSPPTPSPTVIDTRHPTDLAVDPSTGDLYVDEGDQIHVFDSTGASTYIFGDGDFGNAGFTSWSTGVAVVGNAGKAYVADPAANKIKVYPLLTRLLKTSFGTFSGQSPRGLTVDQSNGDVYAINFNNNTLDRFDASGSPKNFTCGTCSGNQLSIPTINSIDVDLVHVAIDRSGGPSNGNIYVTDGSGAGVDVFANSGALLTTLTGSGTFDGAFSVAVGVSVDQQNGDVYISDAGNSRIYRYSPSGSTVAEGDYSGAITTDITAGSVAADAGKVYLGDTCCFSDSTVERYNATDFALGSPPTPSPTVIDTRHPTDLAVDPSTGDLYVDEGDQIHVFDSTGASTYIFGDGDFGTAGFTSWSTGVAVVGNAGKAYVADPAANKIKVYGPFAGGPHLPPPSVSTGAATAIGLDTATLNGSVNPHSNSLTGCRFEYTDDASYQANVANSVNAFTGAQTAACDTIPAGNTAVDVHADVGSLSGATTYHYRLVAGTTKEDFAADPATFTTDPLAFTDAATAIHHTDATLNGHVDDQGVAAFNVTDCHFDWGTDTSYSGGTVPCVPGPAYSGPTAVTANLPSLHPGDTYHFRLHVGTTSAGSYTGADQSFTTAVFPVLADAATNVHHTDLTLNGHFDPQGDPALNVTDCHIDWGLTTAYSGGSLPCAQSGPFSSATNVSAFAQQPQRRHHLPLPPPPRHRRRR